MSELNDAQRRAVEYANGPLIVLAGPGTGKTRVITSRLRRLIEEGAEPETLLALTFSVKAAEEMRTRLAAAVGERIAERVRAQTFHAFGNSILMRFGDMLGLPQVRDFMDSAQRKRLLREIIRTHRLFGGIAALGPDAAITRAAEFIEACRHAARTPEDAAEYARRWESRLSSAEDPETEKFRLQRFIDCARAFDLFDRACIERGLITFDQCLALPLRLMKARPIVASILREEIGHIVIDEYQDVDRAQIQLLECVAPPRNSAGRSPDLCIVGDDDQSIYAFRGADPMSFKRFTDIWTDATTIPLTVNYRSGAAVIDLANAHILRCGDRFAPDKESEPSPEAPQAIVEGVVVDEDGLEGSAIAAMIRLDRARNPGRRYSDYAILGRSHTAVGAAAATLESLDIPVIVRRRLTPLDDPGVQDLLAWLSLLVEPAGPGEPAATQRLLARPPYFVPVDTLSRWNESRRAAAWDARSRGEAEANAGFVDWVREHRATEGPVAAFLATLDDLRATALTSPADLVIERIIHRAELVHVEDLTPRERAARVRNLVQALQFARSRQPYLEQPGDIHAFWRYYEDLDDKERQFVTQGAERLDLEEDAPPDPSGSGQERDAVMALTAHASKGLEFDTVFLLRCRPGGFPDRNRNDQPEDSAPAEFYDRAPGNQSEEERRLFYVAATRARRRLVLIAKRKKSKGATIDYYIELTQESPGLAIDQHEGVDLIEQAGLGAPDALDAAERTSDEQRRRQAIIFRAATDARRRAYAALREAGAASLNADGLARIERELAESARDLNAIEVLQATGRLPERVDAKTAERLAPVVDRFRRALAPEPLTRPMSAPLSLSYSAISDYQRCPRCFYVKYVLNLDERKTAELSMGSIVHDALERFYKDWRLADSEGRPTPGINELRECARLALRSQMSGVVDDPQALLASVDAQLAICHEKLHDPSANILEVERKVTFPYPDPRGGSVEHRITAKIDRIDQLPSGGIRLVDYKSGKATKKLVTPPADDLQMCIYRLALPSLLGEDAAADSLTGAAEYWVLSEGVKGEIDFRDMKLDKAKAAIDKAITGMLEGQFGRGKECKGLCALLPPDIEEA